MPETMMPGRLTVAVVADDLTGAADTGVQFCADGPIHLQPAASAEDFALPGPAAGLALFTNSRHDSPAAAAAKVRLAAGFLRQFAPGMIYKKIDSCLRGNIGAEIDALVETLQCRASFIAPALPGQGRTTENDVHRVWGLPVGESQMAADPLCPVTESRLSRLIAAQSRLPVGRVDLADVAAGPQRLREAIQARLDEGCRHIAFDATRNTHLDAIAEAAGRFFTRILMVGSAGLAQSLAAAPGNAPPQPAAEGRLRRMLWVCGSAAPLLAHQIEVLSLAAGVFPTVLPAHRLAAAADHEAAFSCLESMWADWDQGVRLLCIEPVGKRPPSAPAAVAAGLARIAAEVIRRTGPDGLFLTGGETAEAVWRRLGAGAIRLSGEILPGVIRGQWIGGAMDGRTVITRAGAFGEPDTLWKLHQAIIEKVTT